MKADIIKKLKLKKGCKYILIIPESTGLTKKDVQSINHEFVELSIMVKSTRGIKVIEDKKKCRFCPPQKGCNNPLTNIK